MRDKRYADVLELFEQRLAQHKEGGHLLGRTGVEAVLECKALTSGVPAALATLSLLSSQHDFEAQASTYAAVMQGCIEGGDTTTARSLYDSLLASGKPADHDVFNTLIMVHCVARDFDGADQLFVEMREADPPIKPKRISYLRFINGCFRAKEGDRAFAKLQQMEAEWRVPSDQDYERMFQHFVRLKHKAGRDMCMAGLQASGSEALVTQRIPEMLRDALDHVRDEPEAVLSLYEAAITAGIRVPRHEMHGVVYAHMEMQNPVKAFEQVVAICEAGHTPVPRIVETLAAELCREAELVDDAYYVLEARRTEGRPVPLAPINVIIEACAQLEDLDRAFATWGELEAFGLAPDVNTFNALLHTCVRTREIGSGQRLLQRMAAAGIKRDAQSYFLECALLMRSAPRAAQTAERAAQLLDDCKADNLVPTAKMYVTLINFSLRSGAKGEAERLLEEMGEKNHFITPAIRERVAAGHAGRPYQGGRGGRGGGGDAMSGGRPSWR